MGEVDAGFELGPELGAKEVANLPAAGLWRGRRCQRGAGALGAGAMGAKVLPDFDVELRELERVQAGAGAGREGDLLPAGGGPLDTAGGASTRRGGTAGGTQR